MCRRSISVVMARLAFATYILGSGYSLILWTHDWRRSVPLFRPCLVAHLVTAGHLSVEGEEAETWVFGKTLASFIIRC